jgi:hypothetical protein
MAIIEHERAGVDQMGGEELTVDNLCGVDLFWGLRGAGANFGIDTAFEYDLHPLRPIVLGATSTGRCTRRPRSWASCASSRPPRPMTSAS